MTLKRGDGGGWAWLLVILLIATGVGLGRLHTAPPYEDAVMIMRYAEHLAAGAGITWNPGQPPVDGATDFLFLIMVALGIKLGLTAQASVIAWTLAAHLATIGLLYGALRRFGSPQWAALLAALYLAVGPAQGYLLARFGTPVFAFFATLAASLALLPPDRRRRAPAFAAACLLTTLTRPEGLMLSFFLLLSILVRDGWRPAREAAAWWVALFVLIGGSYFLWRWHYFGYPLPNPYYRKGAGHLYFSHLRLALKAGVLMLWPVIPLYGWALWQPEARREALAGLLTPVCFLCIWVLLSPEMNFLYRFQYAAMPICLLGTAPLLGRLGARWPHDRVRNPWATGGIVVFACLTLAWQAHFVQTRGRLNADGRELVGQRLEAWRDRGYVMAVTEAGLLPYFSHWTAIDCLGLNDQWIAHHRLVTDDYLDQWKPTMVMFYATRRDLNRRDPGERARDRYMHESTRVLLNYCQQRGYLLAAAYGENPDRVQVYYVRADCPEAEAVVQAIREEPYPFWRSGRPARNFAYQPNWSLAPLFAESRP